MNLTWSHFKKASQSKSAEWLRKTLNAIGFLCCVEWQEIRLNDSAWLS